MSIHRALISVSDKTGIETFAQSLRHQGTDIIASSGTAQRLQQNDIAITEVSDLTGFPEIFDGRVKTLHPKIHGALLARGERDLAEMQAHGIQAIDLLVVNLYPFVATVSGEHSMDDAIDQIDIGGVALIRAAAKNYRKVLVVVDPKDYPRVLQLQADGGEITEAERLRLARKAFAYITAYDAAISGWLAQQDGEFSDSCGEYSLQTALRYGENPHQKGAFYRNPYTEPPCLLQGKPLSFNNYLDADSAYKIAVEMDAKERFACAIVKHNNPCGVAIRATMAAAYQAAYRTDSMSAFGGVIAFDKPLDADTAQQIISQQFVEVIVAPAFDEGALQVLQQKEQLRAVIGVKDNRNTLQQRSIAGGILVQDNDDAFVSEALVQVVSQRPPSPDELSDMLFAQRVVKHTRSNAIVLVKDQTAIGIGAGQMSRIDAVQIAARKAQDNDLDVSASVLASDAFFPFRDGLDYAQTIGVCAIIQPGGSKNDAKIIAAADEHNMAMVFTAIRHFKH